MLSLQTRTILRAWCTQHHGNPLSRAGSLETWLNTVTNARLPVQAPNQAHLTLFRFAKLGCAYECSLRGHHRTTSPFHVVSPDQASFLLVTLLVPCTRRKRRRRKSCWSRRPRGPPPRRRKRSSRSTPDVWTCQPLPRELSEPSREPGHAVLPVQVQQTMAKSLLMQHS